MMKCYKRDYPRPQFVRRDWTSLNGGWDFAFDDEKRGLAERWYETFPAQHLEIQVPFSCETEKSGIHDETAHPCVWYHTAFAADMASLEKKRLLLHFEGSDFLTGVWVNGRFAGSHRGGYARFTFDITDLVKDGDNALTVRVEDSADVQQPRGKQRWMKNSFGCWYVQTTGIWKTVWLEQVPEIRLDHVKMTPRVWENLLQLDLTVAAPAACLGPDLAVEAEVSFGGKRVSRVSCAMLTDRQTLLVDMNMFGKDEDDYPWDVMLWTPDQPCLYDLDLRVSWQGAVTDEVGSYFAMREVRTDGPNVLLNGEPLYQRLILDQGYWKDSGLTAPDEDALILDIDRILSMGYNGVRKHQKIEDERFLYWCDVKGLMVWSEAPAAYAFSDEAVAEFTSEWMEIVKQNYNHPCIITWTPFNESWGVSRVKKRADQQHFTEAVYHLTRAMDPFRPIIVNDGWEHTVSDIITLHDYEEKGEVLRGRYVNLEEDILGGKAAHNCFKTAFADGHAYRGQPVIITEFGGIAFDSDESGWGYGNKVAGEEEFLKRFDDITTAIKEIPYVCGYCYTQVTDVQQEVNGLMDMDRRCKVDPEKIREINLRRVGFRR